MALIRQLDDRRNQIVHWTSSIQQGIEQGQPFATAGLVRQGFTGGSEISLIEIKEFSEKAFFITQSLRHFATIALGGPEFFFSPIGDEAQTWRNIFQRPASYPPEDAHPLSQNYIAPEIPPSPSEA
jgi:hypothetical protein